MLTKTPLLFEQSKENRVGFKIPKSDVKRIALNQFIPEKYLRKTSPNLPELTEFQVVRHFTNLSVKNHHVDKDFYPLGSCTMKYNPKINDHIASFPGFSLVHPNQTYESIQGALKVYYSLEKILTELTGMDKTSLQPSAGSQGEMVGLLLMKKYHQKHKIKNKKFIIIPETAHGTNPASVIMSGYQVKQVKSNNSGRVDLNHLKELVNSEVAGMMLTQPNTLGLFENEIEEICKIIHDVDGLMYMDGANLNALVGIAKPSDMGFDIMHINLHKTFSTPHGGGGPGAGPVAVNKKLSEFLSNPHIAYNDTNKKYYFDYSNNDTIGRVHSFYGNFGILVRAYVYILSLGKKGLKSVAENAVLNANYLKCILKEYYEVPYDNGTLHEFVISAQKQKKKGYKALLIAKKILDYGFHSPTVYFPINVDEAIMIEPTETETKETLENFANSMIEINHLIDKDDTSLHDAPYNTPVRKLDETKANRELNVRWQDDV